MRVVAFFAAGVLVLAFGVSTSASQRGVTCDAWAGPSGSDEGAGTRGSPFRTATRLAQGLRPGQTGCLEPGAVFIEHLVIGGQGSAGARITITTPSGARATIADGVEFLQSSRYVTLSRVAVSMTGNEPANALPAVVHVAGFRNHIVRSNISGGSVVDKSRTCILIDHGNLIVVDRNEIHRCGIVKSNQAIIAPGVNVATGSNARITNNVIHSTPGDAVSLYPNAKETLVARNVFDGTSNGVFFGGDAKFASKRNKVVNNIFSFIPGHGVYAATFVTGGSPGVDNVASANCFWQIGQIPVGGPGVTGKDNKSADPQFMNRPSTYEVKKSSPCWMNRPLP